MPPLRASHAAPLLLAALAACAEPSSIATVVRAPPVEPASSTAAPLASVAPAPAAPPAVSAAAPVARSLAWHRVPLEIRPGAPPCTFAFEAEIFKDEVDTLQVESVRRITTEEGGSCAAATLFDLTQEPNPHPEEALELLEGSMLVKPGHADAPGLDLPGVPNLLVDLNFDGWADLCWVVKTGAYSYNQKCWLFDPRARRYVRNRELDFVVFAKIDPTQKKLSTASRVAGPTHSREEYAWEKGKLVKTLEIVFTVGETPDEKPLPPGYEIWVQRRERRGGRLVKVKEGPERNNPAYWQ